MILKDSLHRQNDNLHNEKNGKVENLPVKAQRKSKVHNRNIYGKTESSHYISIIILSVNGLNSPIKIKKLAEWIKKQDPSICYPQEHLTNNDKQTKRKDAKRYSMLTESKIMSRCSHPNIKQNKF